MEEFLGRKYKLKSSENFDEYMKFIDVGLLSRKTATSVSPVATLTRGDDGTYTLTMTTFIRTVKVTFKLGEEFVEDRADGVKVKSTITMEGNVLTQIQIEDNGRKSKHVRTFTEDTLTVVSTAEGWDGTCIRIYEYTP